MMGLFFRNGPGAIDEIQRLPEVRKAEHSVQMMLIYDFPVRNFSPQGLQRIAFERRNAAAAGNARFVC